MFFSVVPVALLQYLFDTVYGATMMFLLSGIPRTRRNMLSMGAVVGLSYALVVAAVLIRGLEGMGAISSLCVHLPFILFISFSFKRPPSLVFLANLIVYFSLSPRLILGEVSVLIAQNLDFAFDASTARRFGYMATGPLILLPMYRWFVRPLHDLIDQPKAERLMLLVFGGTCYLTVQVLSITAGRLGPLRPLVYSVLFVLFLFALLSSLVMYSRKLRESGEARARMAAYANQAEGLRLYADALREFLDETRRLRHDQRHLLSLIDMHAANGDLPGVRRLAGEHLAALGMSSVHESGSGVADGLIALYRMRAREHGVAIDIAGAGFQELPLSEDDLCLLLSNCLENAVAAAKMVEDRERVVALSVSRDARSQAAALEIRNPSPAPVEFNHQGLPISSRGTGHGYGASSMRSVVEKHGGVCGFAVEDGDFVFRAAFLPGQAAGADGRRSLR
jgi:hypothetical protein